MFFSPEKNLIRFKNRRTRILDQIKSINPGNKNGALLIIADFENERYAFKQESSFYYLTGITEPGVVLCCYFDGSDVLYLPFYGQDRGQWVKANVSINSLPTDFCVDQIKYMGQEFKGYSSAPFFTMERYEELVADIKKNIGPGGLVHTLMDSTSSKYFIQMQLVACLQNCLFAEKIRFSNCSDIIHQARRIKESYETNLIYKATQITSMAMQVAAKTIEPERFEYQIQALIEYVFREAACSNPAFPTIVATGENTTILHSNDRTGRLRFGDLVVVDIGAEYGNYASDLTRTFPVGGKFSSRQKEVYEIVLQTQQHIESLAVPGMYLNNSKLPEKSLHHHAIKFLQKQGYAQYFVHGIGHFLGLDVHDVGNYQIPLQAGDVFTVEPGIYIPQERIGVRIEDDYVMADDGAVCLSGDLVKQTDDIEALMKGQ